MENKIRDINDLYLFIENFNQNKNLSRLDKISLIFQYSDESLSIFKLYYTNLDNISSKNFVILEMLKNKLELDFGNISTLYCREMINLLSKFINQVEQKFILKKLFKILWILILKIEDLNIIQNIINNIDANKYLFLSIAPKLILENKNIIIDLKKLNNFEKFLNCNFSKYILKIIFNNININSLNCFKNWLLILDDNDIKYLINNNYIKYTLFNLTSKDCNKICLKVLKRFLYRIPNIPYKIQIYNNLYNIISKFINNSNINIYDNLVIMINILTDFIGILNYDINFFNKNTQLFSKYYCIIISYINLIGVDNKIYFYNLKKLFKNIDYYNIEIFKNNLILQSIPYFCDYFKLNIYNFENNNSNEHIYYNLEQRESNSTFLNKFLKIIDYDKLYEKLMEYLNKQDFSNILNETKINNNLLIFESIIFIVNKSLKFLITNNNKENLKNILNENQMKFIILLINIISKFSITNVLYYQLIFNFYYSVIPFINNNDFIFKIHNYILNFNIGNSNKLNKLKYKILYKLCSDYTNELQQFKEIYYNIWLSNKHDINIINSIICFIKLLGKDDMDKLFINLITIYLNELINFKNCMCDNNICIVLININIISNILQKIDKNKANDNFLANILEELGHILYFIIDNYTNNENLVENIIKIFVIVLEKIVILNIRLINFIFSRITNYYTNYPYGCFLYLIEKGLKYTSYDTNKYDLISNIYNELVKISINNYKNNNNFFNENPNLLIDIYGLQYTSLKYNINVVFNDELIYEFLNQTLEILLLKELILPDPYFYFLLRFYEYLIKNKLNYNDLYNKIELEFNEKLIVNLINNWLNHSSYSNKDSLVFKILYYIFSNFNNSNLIFINFISILDDRIINKEEKHGFNNILQKFYSCEDIRMILNHIFVRFHNFSKKFKGIF